jgi:hypothetical protein
VHPTPACVTEILALPTVTVADRLDLDELGATVKGNVPLPLPGSPRVSHVALLTAVHLQPSGAVTLMLPFPPAAENDVVSDEME